MKTFSIHALNTRLDATIDHRSETKSLFFEEEEENRFDLHSLGSPFHAAANFSTSPRRIDSRKLIGTDWSIDRSTLSTRLDSVRSLSFHGRLEATGPTWSPAFRNRASAGFIFVHTPWTGHAPISASHPTKSNIVFTNIDSRKKGKPTIKQKRNDRDWREKKKEKKKTRSSNSESSCVARERRGGAIDKKKTRPWPWLLT